MKPWGGRFTTGLSVLCALVLPACKGTLDAGWDLVDLQSTGGQGADSTEATGGVTGASGESTSGYQDASVEPDTSPEPDVMVDPDAGPPSTAGSSGGGQGGQHASETMDSGSPADGGDTDDSELDAGTDPERLPVDNRNPVVLHNDLAYDNWFGEYALLAANAGLLNLVGMIVGNSAYWPIQEYNQEGWDALMGAASEAGLAIVPEMIASSSEALVEPESGVIDATVPNNSPGARYIVDVAQRLGTPSLPLAIVTGSTLTDVADAYLLEPSIAERVIVVAAMGTPRPTGSRLGGPNGDLDPWASNIVAQRIRLVHVTSYYEQVEDVPEARLTELPANAFGTWIAGKREDVTEYFAADQIALLATALPNYALSVARASYAGLDDEGTPLLELDAAGQSWSVTTGDDLTAAAFLWMQLLDPGTFVP